MEGVILISDLQGFEQPSNGPITAVDGKAHTVTLKSTLRK
jgi:hypothetical protein